MLASQFLNKLKQLDYSKLEETKGLGSILLSNLEYFITSNRFNTLQSSFEQLESQNIGLALSSNQTNIQGILTGQTICITGSFDESRDSIALSLTKLGAKITNAVTSSTTLLLVGDKPGSKVAKAQGLGIKIAYSIDEIIIA